MDTKDLSFDRLLDSYEDCVKSLRGGNQSYSDLEILQLEIAKRILRLIGVPTAPDGILPETKQPIEKPMKQGFVYLMRNNRNGLIKIGWSTKPQIRERTLQSEEPEVEMFWTCPGTTRLERAIHATFSSFRVRGEWFRLDPAQISRIQEFSKG